MALCGIFTADIFNKENAVETTSDLKNFLKDAQENGTDCGTVEKKITITEILLWELFAIKEELEQMHKICSKPQKKDDCSGYGV